MFDIKFEIKIKLIKFILYIIAILVWRIIINVFIRETQIYIQIKCCILLYIGTFQKR